MLVQRLNPLVVCRSDGTVAMSIMGNYTTDIRRTNRLAVLGLTLLLSLVPALPMRAQVEQVNKSGRKVAQKLKPEYPRSLREAHIGGTVRLQVTVLASGEVSKVDALGGNPVFVESATKAVLKWKFVPATAQSTEEVQLHFNPE